MYVASGTPKIFAQRDVRAEGEQQAALAVRHREAAVRAHIEALVFQRTDQRRNGPWRAVRQQVHAQLGIVAGDETVQGAGFGHHVDHVRHFGFCANFVGHRAQARDEVGVLDFVQGRGARGHLHAGLQLGVDAAVDDRFPVAADGQADVMHRLGTDQSLHKILLNLKTKDTKKTKYKVDD